MISEIYHQKVPNIEEFRKQCLSVYTADTLIEGVYNQLLERYFSGEREGSEVVSFQQKLLLPFLQKHPELWQESGAAEEWMVANLLEEIMTVEGATVYIINRKGIAYLLEAIGLIH